MPNLTVRDYYNINTINTYYNEIYDCMLNIDNNNIYDFAILLKKYNRYIKYNNFLYSSNFIKHFENIIKQCNYAIREYGTDDAYMYWINPNLALEICVNNIEILNNKSISIIDKINVIIKNIIDEICSGDIIGASIYGYDIENIYFDNDYYNMLMIDHINNYYLENKKPEQYNRLDQYHTYPEIRILTRFIEKYVIKYSIYLKNKKKHKEKYNDIMIELIYLPNIGIEYKNAKQNFNLMYKEYN